MRRSSELLGANQRVDQVGEQQHGANTAETIQDFEGDHDRPPSGFSSFWKPQTSKTITPQRAAMPNTKAISINPSPAKTMGEVSDPAYKNGDE
jgi:hypothetical protein